MFPPVRRVNSRGLVERTSSADDRRKVIVRLTRSGLDLVDRVAVTHLETERGILKTLSLHRQRDLARSLRTVLLDLGDHDEFVPD